MADTRRNYLIRTGALASAVTLTAGCLGDDDGNGDSDGDSNGDSSGDSNGDGNGDSTGNGDDDGTVSGTVEFHHIAGGTSLPIDVARNEGLFDESEVEIEREGYTDPSSLYNRIQGGELDSFWGAPNVMARAHNQQENIRLLWPCTIGDNVMIIGPEDAESMADLEGMSIGTFPSSSATHVLMSVAVSELHGLDYEDDYNLHELAPPNSYASFVQGDLDAVVLNPPLDAMAASQEGADYVVGGTELYTEATGHDFHVTIGAARADYLDDNREQLEEAYGIISEACQMMRDDPEGTLVDTEIIQNEFEIHDQPDEVISEAAENAAHILGSFAGYGDELSSEEWRGDLEQIFEDSVEYELLDEVPNEDIFDDLF